MDETYLLTERYIGRSDRSRIGQQVEGHAGFRSCRPEVYRCDKEAMSCFAFSTLKLEAAVEIHYHFLCDQRHQVSESILKLSQPITNYDSDETFVHGADSNFSSITLSAIPRRSEISW